MHSKKFEFTLHYANLSLVPEKFQRQMHHGRTYVRFKAVVHRYLFMFCQLSSLFQTPAFYRHVSK